MDKEKARAKNKPTDKPTVPMEITDNPVLLRALIADMVKVLKDGTKSRPRSIATTKLEEASMWLNEELMYHD